MVQKSDLDRGESSRVVAYRRTSLSAKDQPVNFEGKDAMGRGAKWKHFRQFYFRPLSQHLCIFVMKHCLLYVAQEQNPHNQ